MNEVIIKDNIKIENMIYEIRGVQVITHQSRTHWKASG